MNKEDYNEYTREFDRLIGSLGLVKSDLRFMAHQVVIQNAIEAAVQKHRLESQEQQKQGEQLSLLLKGKKHHGA